VSDERVVRVDGVELCLETFGRDGDPAVLLIGGSTASMDWWDAELCRRLAAEGRFVVRYDHRDTGRSTTSPPGSPVYSVRELTTDPLRVLDALGIRRAHLVGVSMGGGIAQELGALHPDRVLTLTLVATSTAGTRTGDSPLPQPQPEIAALFRNPPPDPDWTDRAAVVEDLVAAERAYAGPLGFEEARARRIAEAVVDRSHDVAAGRNHWTVIGADDDGLAFRMADLDVPTLVVHGTDDPLFPLPHGEALAAEIFGASLLTVPGMGHQVPPERTWDVVVPAIVRHTAPTQRR
jgi:pimeloyl-ACP methyl ester carboxylesterase